MEVDARRRSDPIGVNGGVAALDLPATGGRSQLSTPAALLDRASG
jgi:hypothetical protein